MRTRAWRRHQRDRYLKKILNQLKTSRRWFDLEFPQPHRFWAMEERMNRFPAREYYIPPLTWDEVFEKRLQSAHELEGNRSPCSCHMCGNPRRHWGEYTQQERVADINEYEQLHEEELSEKLDKLAVAYWAGRPCRVQKYIR